MITSSLLRKASVVTLVLVVLAALVLLYAKAWPEECHTRYGVVNTDKLITVLFIEDEVERLEFELPDSLSESAKDGDVLYLRLKGHILTSICRHPQPSGRNVVRDIRKIVESNGQWYSILCGLEGNPIVRLTVPANEAQVLAPGHTIIYTKVGTMKADFERTDDIHDIVFVW